MMFSTAHADPYPRLGQVMAPDKHGSEQASEEFAPEWDLARVALAAQRNDAFLLDLIELAENGVGSIVGVLFNGMVAVGVIASPEAVAEILDEQRRQWIDRSEPPSGRTSEEWERSVEFFVTENTRAVQEVREERERIKDSESAPWDYSVPLRGDARRALEAESHYNLTLVRPQVVAPGQTGAIRPPVLRIALSQVAGWWPVPTDDDGKASFQVFSLDPS